MVSRFSTARCEFTVRNDYEILIDMIIYIIAIASLFLWLGFMRADTYMAGEEREMARESAVWEGARR